MCPAVIHTFSVPWGIYAFSATSDPFYIICYDESSSYPSATGTFFPL